MSFQERLSQLGKKEGELQTELNRARQKKLEIHARKLTLRHGLTAEVLRVHGLRLTPHTLRLQWPPNPTEIDEADRHNIPSRLLNHPYSFIICEEADGRVVFVEGVQAEHRSATLSGGRSSNDGFAIVYNYSGRHDFSVTPHITGTHVVLNGRNGKRDFHYMLTVQVGDQARNLTLPYAVDEGGKHVAIPKTSQEISFGGETITADILGGQLPFYTGYEESLISQGKNGNEVIGGTIVTLLRDASLRGPLV